MTTAPTDPTAAGFDPATLDDAALSALTTACRREEDTREYRRHIPEQVTQLADAYKTAGGDVADLHAAIDAAADPTEGGDTA